MDMPRALSGDPQATIPSTGTWKTGSLSELAEEGHASLECCPSSETSDTPEQKEALVCWLACRS